jgi:hypothetical protein
MDAVPLPSLFLFNALESPCKMLKGAGQFKLVGKGKQKALFQVK